MDVQTDTPADAKEQMFLKVIDDHTPINKAILLRVGKGVLKDWQSGPEILNVVSKIRMSSYTNFASVD